jgi:DNA-binding transcriptional LysR family regulator
MRNTPARTAPAAIPAVRAAPHRFALHWRHCPLPPTAEADLTLVQLRTFQRVAQLKGFTRAAKELQLTQPAVSAQIDALEREFGVRLFDRIGRGATLTAAGEIVLEAATGILRHLDEMQQALDDLAGLARGTLRLGASLVIGVYLLPAILGRFQREHPKIRVALRIEYAQRIVEEVLAGALDLGIIGEGIPIADERLVVEPFLKDELVVVVPPGHAWSGRRQVRPAELSNEPFVLPGKDLATAEFILREVEAAGIALNVALEFGNMEAAKKAVEAGLGISIISRCAILEELKAGRLMALRVTGMPLKRNLSFIWRRGRHASTLARTFREFFVTHLDAVEGIRGA